MAGYQLTNKAYDEITAIYEYSVLNFGLKIARSYINGLHSCLSFLADNQSFGNDYGFVYAGLHRYEYRSHSIYYIKTKNGILIARVLGKRQNPLIHIH